MAALKQNGHTIMLVSEDLNIYREIVMAKINQYDQAL